MMHWVWECVRVSTNFFLSSLHVCAGGTWSKIHFVLEKTRYSSDALLWVLLFFSEYDMTHWHVRFTHIRCLQTHLHQKICVPDIFHSQSRGDVAVLIFLPFETLVVIELYCPLVEPCTSTMYLSMFAWSSFLLPKQSIPLDLQKRLVFAKATPCPKDQNGSLKLASKREE